MSDDSTLVRVMFRRQVQPAQYEAAEALVEVSKSVPDTEDWGSVTAAMLTRCRAQALSAVDKGPAVPETAAAKKGGKKATKATKAEEPKAAEPEEPAEEPKADKEPWETAAEDTPEQEEVSDQVLQAAATKAAQRFGDKGAAKVKSVMAKFEVARLGALPQDKRHEFLAALDGLK